MLLHKGFQACQGLLLLLAHTVKQATAATNFTQCLNAVVDNASTTNNLTGLLNSVGQPVTNATDTTAISYSLCLSACGSAQESLQWTEFSQEFSAWLLPFLALISQLPFGAQYRLDNFMSALLAVGSPVLAGYSLFITVLNSRWINRRFKQSVNYPNASYAVPVLSSLQQVPLRLHFGLPDFPSLIILPENDPWWKCFAEFVNYTHSTWSIASATAIAWVVVAYILAVINSLTNVDSNLQSNGEATGSLWLWLVPIVIGWLQLSPKCDFDRLQQAYERAERHGRPAIAAAHHGHAPASTQKALTITATEEDVMSPDELLTPPIFNYSRSLPWSSTAEATFLMFKKATHKADSGIPVRIGVGWINSEHHGVIHPMNRLGSLEEIAMYCSSHDAMESHWAPGVFTRMAIASCAALALQWGTVGGAIIVAIFTPTTGLGCRSMGYLIYGSLSTLVWMMLLSSSILAHYSSATYYRQMPTPPSARFSLAFSHALRRIGKLLAIINTFVVILASVFQYSGFYDRCFCNSSVISRGTGGYDVITETAAQAAQAKSSWIGALALTCGSAAAFLCLLNLLLDKIG